MNLLIYFKILSDSSTFIDFSCEKFLINVSKAYVDQTI